MPLFSFPPSRRSRDRVELVSFYWRPVAFGFPRWVDPQHAGVNRYLPPVAKAYTAQVAAWLSARVDRGKRTAKCSYRGHRARVKAQGVPI